MKQFLTVILCSVLFNALGQAPPTTLSTTTLAGNYYVMTYHNDYAITDGLKIKTQIPANQQHMPTININGYNYANAATVGLQIAWYGDGSGNFNNPIASSTGSVIPDNIYLAEENGYVVIFFEQWGNELRFTISAFAEGYNEDKSWFDNWEIVDENVWGNYLTSVYVFNKFKEVEASGISTQGLYANSLTAGSSWLGDAGASRLKLNGSSNYISNESFRGGQWGFFERRLDITNTNTPMLYLSRPNSNSPLNNGNGGLVLAIAGGPFAWGIGDPGDVVFAKEGGGGGAFKFNTNTDYRFYTGITEKVRLDNSGNFGIGTSTPSQKLDVNGNTTISGKLYIGAISSSVINLLPSEYVLAVNGSAIFNKVKVKVYPWADYVFEPGYKLKPLSMVEDFIKKNKHLPDVPSASEVHSNGVEIGETQAILLKKIEELTLYIIEMEKRIKSLEAKSKK